MRLALAPPDWAAVIGGSDESSWLVDRVRKLAIALRSADEVVETAARLAEQNSLFEAKPATLRAVPTAADWYISLAGYSLKTLKSTRERPRTYGLQRSASAVVEAFRARRAVADSEAEAFCKFVTPSYQPRYRSNDGRRRSRSLSSASSMGVA